MKPIITLARDERIIAVVPEYASGSGWANSIVWVHIVNSSGEYRYVDLQPEEQTKEIRTLFAVAAQVHAVLLAAVDPLVKVSKK